MGRKQPHAAMHVRETPVAAYQVPKGVPLAGLAETHCTWTDVLRLGN